MGARKHNMAERLKAERKTKQLPAYATARLRP